MPRWTRSAGMADGARKTALDGEIDKLVNLQTHSSEGPLSTGTRTRDHLAYLQSDLDFGYNSPTAAQYAVFAQPAPRGGDRDSASPGPDALIAETFGLPHR